LIAGFILIDGGVAELLIFDCAQDLELTFEAFEELLGFLGLRATHSSRN
jgi:hypothetical protein